jgi:hypothetical protein
MRIFQAYYKYIASGLGHLPLHRWAKIDGKQQSATVVPIGARALFISPAAA